MTAILFLIFCSVPAPCPTEAPSEQCRLIEPFRTWLTNWKFSLAKINTGLPHPQADTRKSPENQSFPGLKKINVQSLLGAKP
ncbi:hypothetical protein [Ensifer sp. 4252]|uniref:hypothetical protein n=1 Tax=Ensifer sp. 4252 TaxID=3373915 RepID=UPI003D1FEC10